MRNGQQSWINSIHYKVSLNPILQLLIVASLNGTFLQASKLDWYSDSGHLHSSLCLYAGFVFEEFDPSEIFRPKRTTCYPLISMWDVFCSFSALLFPRGQITQTKWERRCPPGTCRSFRVNRLIPPEGGDEYCQTWNSLTRVVRSGWWWWWGQIVRFAAGGL